MSFTGSYTEVEPNFDARLDLLGKDCFNKLYSNFTGSSLNKRSNLSDVPQNVEVIFENLVMS